MAQTKSTTSLHEAMKAHAEFIETEEKASISQAFFTFAQKVRSSLFLSLQEQDTERRTSLQRKLLRKRLQQERLQHLHRDRLVDPCFTMAGTFLILHLD